MSAVELMLIIKALDPGASVKYSEYTRQWYVESRLSVGNGTVLTGVAEHRGTPNDAIQAFFARLTDLTLDEYVASDYHGRRREWRWNGAAFAECTRDEVFAREAELAAQR